ncbi:hypothetical protein ACFL2R_01795 [Patescibacteria group bacterium]
MGKILGVIIFIIAAVAAGSLYWVNSEQPSNSTSEVVEKESSVNTSEGEVDMDRVIYYYGDECPHCRSVMIFLEEYNVAAKVDFEKKEVWHNKDNKSELDKVARKCGKDPKRIGVPFLLAKGKCYMGLPDVKNYFKEELGMLKK